MTSYRSLDRVCIEFTLPSHLPAEARRTARIVALQAWREGKAGA